jgi:O-antigen ligase
MNKSHRSQAEKEKKEFSLLSPKPNFERFAFYLLILFLPTQFGKHFWPPFSQVLGIRVDYLSPTLYFTDLIILVLFLLWSKRQNLRSLLHRIAQKRVWLIFFLYLPLTILLSDNPLPGLYELAKIAELVFLGFYIVENVKNKKELAKIAQVSSLAIISQSLLAIAQYIHQGSLNGVFYLFGERKFVSGTPGIANASINGQLILRPYGTFSHPNVLAGFLLCFLILIFYVVDDKKDIKKKILKITTLLLGSLALLLTLSRIAIILWFLLIIIALCHKLIKLKNKSPILVMTVVLVILLTVISISIFTPVLARLQGTRFTEEAVTQREELLKATGNIILSRPLFGVGLHNFLPTVGRVQKPLSPTLYLQPVHNILLLIMAEIGIIGLIFFLWFLFKTYQHLRRLPNNTRNVLMIILSVILILGLFDHYWLTLQQGQLLFALFLGLCWAF